MAISCRLDLQAEFEGGTCRQKLQKEGAGRTCRCSYMQKLQQVVVLHKQLREADNLVKLTILQCVMSGIHLSIIQVLEKKQSVLCAAFTTNFPKGLF